MQDVPMTEGVTIYTDGACSGNGTVGSYGGWAVVFVLGAHELEFSGAERGTTNQQMELRAAIEGLRALRRPSRVTLYCDSSYVDNCYRRRWRRRWQENGWRNSARQPVANRALWEELLELTALHEVTWVKVKGHAESELNNRCDRLAVAARMRLAAELAEGEARAAAAVVTPAELD
jgi:ribonuclease HI